MARKNKPLDDLASLVAHIDAYAVEHGTGFDFQKFEQSMELGQSALGMAKLARCNVKTIRKWRAVYMSHRGDML